MSKHIMCICVCYFMHFLHDSTLLKNLKITIYILLQSSKEKDACLISKMN